MLQLMVEVPEPLEQQVKASGLSQKQLGIMMTYFLQTYLNLNQIEEFITIKPVGKIDGIHRRAGSAKHLGITMTDDFDEPLDDFAEYM